MAPTMRNNLPPYIAVLIGIMLFAFSCGTSKDAAEGDKTKNISDKELREILFEKSKVPFDFFYTKIGVDFKKKNVGYSFNATVKMRVDSAFSGTIKYAMIVGGLYLVDTDSLFFVNKQEDCYYAEDITFISSLFGTEIEYDFFQSLLLGLPIGLDDEIKYKQIKSKDEYILSSHKKKDFKKLENDRLDLEENDDIFILYHMAPETFDLTKINIQVPSDTVEINIDFKSRKLEGEFEVPGETLITVYHPRDTISINLDYGSVEINDPKKINITIPESYAPCP